MKYFFVYDGKDHNSAALAYVFEKCAQASDATLQPLAMNTEGQWQHLLYFLAQSGARDRTTPLVIQHDPQTGARTVVAEADMRHVVYNLCCGSMPRRQLREIVQGVLGPTWSLLLDALGCSETGTAAMPTATAPPTAAPPLRRAVPRRVATREDQISARALSVSTVAGGSGGGGGGGEEEEEGDEHIGTSSTAAGDGGGGGKPSRSRKINISEVLTRGRSQD